MEENVSSWNDEIVKNKKNQKYIKNLISLIILLSGMFLGSLFIDFSQLVQKNGFSVGKIGQSDIFEANGKTWVAYTQPAIDVKVVNDANCEQCNVDEILVWLRRILPTIATEKVDYKSEEGKHLIEKFDLKTLPAFVFGPEAKSTDFYMQAKALFDEKDNQLALRTQDVGIPVGEYIKYPQINDGDAISGVKDAKVRVVVFSDFQCPYCKLFHTILRDMMKKYADNVVFDYKFFPLDNHAQANDASLASGCALEQNKFWEYADKLYSDQLDWSNEHDLIKFKEYAKILSLDVVKFNQCLDKKKYQTKIDTDKKEAESFAITETPGVFINNQFQTGAISAEQLKAIIDSELAK